MLAELPLPAGLLLTFALGLIAGAAVNWATYAWAWNRRDLSPWSAPHPAAPPRRRSDLLPVWGWLGLRREAGVHGRGFWLRPLCVELLMGVGLAALYWWEVDRQGLVRDQFAALPAGVGDLATAPVWTTVATFVAHAVLIALMAVASLIDLDEKLIPDNVTVSGTLLALALAAVSPLGLLPHVDVRTQTPPAGAPAMMPGELPLAGPPAGVRIFVEPVTLAAPNAWPASLNGAPSPWSLAVGLACFGVWCMALTPRIWRTRRGWWYGLGLVGRRVVRELRRPPLAWIAAVGTAGILGGWVVGGGAWVGLLTALVGMIGGGAMVWAVRIVGSAALRREAMGFGDVTLMMMVGAFLGWQAGVIIFFLAPFAGMVVGIAQLVFRRGDVIPYGPFLCLAALVVMLRWADVWNMQPGGIQGVFGLGWLIPAVLAVCVVMLWAALVLWRNVKEAIFHASAAD